MSEAAVLLCASRIMYGFFVCLFTTSLGNPGVTEDRILS